MPGVVRAESLVPEDRRSSIGEDRGFRALFLSLEKGPGKAPCFREAVRLSGRSEGVFKRVFKALTGRAWTRFVTVWRLTEGERRLGSRFAQVKSVALEVGFGSTSAFSNAYLRHFGRRPRRSRKAGAPPTDRLTDTGKGPSPEGEGPPP